MENIGERRPRGYRSDAVFFAFSAIRADPADMPMRHITALTRWPHSY